MWSLAIGTYFLILQSVKKSWIPVQKAWFEGLYIKSRRF